MGVYRAVLDRIPTIQYGILIPILIGGLLISRSPRLARIIDAVPQHWLIGVQLYRALGVIFLILYGTGKLPGAFAWPAGLGDTLVGILAPVSRLPMRVHRIRMPIWSPHGTFLGSPILSSR